jgi:branched-chain amino acid transport system permease protein
VVRKLGDRMFFQQLINGLMLGSSYALIAVGYSLIFGVMGLLHFAHGEVFMVGAFVALQMVLLAHVSLPIATLGAMTATAILGIIIAAVAFLPIKKEYVAAPLIATMGIGIVMQNLAVKIFGADQVSFPETIEIVNYKIGDVIINSLQIIILCVTLVLMILLSLYVKTTKMGKAMRASAERPTTASLLGVNYKKVVLVTFMIASALAGVAGVLIGLVYSSISPFMSGPATLKGLVIMLMGGLGNLVGAVVCGILLGILEIFSVAYLSATHRDGLTFVILILVLILRPEGLFGIRLHGR